MITHFIKSIPCHRPSPNHNPSNGRLNSFGSYADLSNTDHVYNRSNQYHFGEDGAKKKNIKPCIYDKSLVINYPAT